MSPTFPTISAPLRTGLLALGLWLTLGLAQAQTAATPTPAAEPAPTAAADATLEGRHNQKIEHITVEDGGARVDEMRYGGVTQSITVQPKSAMPAYEVQPTDARRARQGDGTGGSRVWNVLKF